jgi:hypothetical protein
MPPNHKRQVFDPSCPSGGNWYSCGYGSNFVGCCKSQPCDNDCPAGNLEPASFNINYYGQFPDQQCPKGSQWYTCAYTKPAFMGCCKSNPCEQNGCPTEDLTPGFLSSNPTDAAAFSPSGGSSTVASSTTSSHSSSTISSAAASTSTISTRASSASTATSETSTTSTQSPTAITAVSKSAPVGAIAGGAAGGVAVLAIIIALLIYYCRHAAKSRKTRNDEVNRRLSFPPAAAIAGDHKAKPPPGKFSYHTSLLSSPNGAPDILADSSLPAYSTPAPYHPARYNPADPAMKPAFELPAGYVSYSRNANGEPASPTQSITRKSLPHRLSELSGESARARAELESPRNSPSLQSPQSPPQGSHSPPQSPQSTRSSGANWTRLPWIGSTNAGIGIEEERLKGGGRRATYEGT